MPPRLLKEVASKVDGQVRLNAGMMARILKRRMGIVQQSFCKKA